MQDNILKDVLIPANTFSLASAATNPENLKIFSYNTMFDYNLVNNNYGKYLDSSYTSTTCTSACNSCYSNGTSKCLTCNPTSSFLSYNTCTSYVDSYKSYYAFVSPTVSNVDLPFSALNLGTKATLTFYLKILGFQDTINSDIIVLGTILKIRYNHSTDSLELARTDTAVILASMTNFASLFGKYVYFSLAYQYDSTKSAYYPPMLNFNVNLTNLPINYSVANLSGLNIQTVTISSKVFGMFARVHFYSFYLLGAYGYDTNTYYVTNTPNIVPSKKLIDETSSTCVAAADLSTVIDPRNIMCYIDYDVYTDSTNYPANVYVPATTTAAQYYNVASGTFTVGSCSSKAVK